MLITNKEIYRLRTTNENGEGTMSDEDVMIHIRDKYESELPRLKAGVTGFAEWIDTSYYEQTGVTGDWYDYRGGTSPRFTTSELYQEYLKQKQ